MVQQDRGNNNTPKQENPSRFGFGLTLAIVGLAIGIGGLKLFEFFGGKHIVSTSSPDSPVVIRGGSLNVFGNGVNWSQSSGSNYVYQVDIGGVPSAMELDGIDPRIGRKTNPNDITLSALQQNWTIAFVLRNKDSGGNPTQAFLCTQLNAGNTGCSLSPSGALAGGLVYFQADQVTPGNLSYDRSQGARLHYPVPNCPLGSGANPDLDPECSKIKTVTLYNVPSYTGPYQCVDGACSIKIAHP
jgi:hypothetical protein